MNFYEKNIATTQLCVCFNLEKKSTPKRILMHWRVTTAQLETPIKLYIGGLSCHWTASYNGINYACTYGIAPNLCSTKNEQKWFCIYPMHSRSVHCNKLLACSPIPFGTMYLKFSNWSFIDHPTVMAFICTIRTLWSWSIVVPMTYLISYVHAITTHLTDNDSTLKQAIPMNWTL